MQVANGYFVCRGVFNSVYSAVKIKLRAQRSKIAEKVMLRAGCISSRIQIKTQVKMNYNILWVTISLVHSSSILVWSSWPWAGTTRCCSGTTCSLSGAATRPATNPASVQCDVRIAKEGCDTCYAMPWIFCIKVGDKRYQLTFRNKSHSAPAWSRPHPSPSPSWAPARRPPLWPRWRRVPSIEDFFCPVNSSGSRSLTRKFLG